MAQIREGRYAVGRVNEEDIDLFDLASMIPVSVETEHKRYDEEFTEEIRQLTEGDVLTGQLQSEDILQPNSIWRFLEFEVIGHDTGWAFS